MGERNFEEEKPTITLRRSPRFLRINQITVEDPRTPELAPRKNRVIDSFSPSLGSSIIKTQKNGHGVSQKGRRKCAQSKGSTKSTSNRPNLSSLDLQKQFVAEKRATRSSLCGRRFVHTLESECGEIQRKGDRKIAQLKNSAKSNNGSRRRSARFSDGANVSRNEDDLDSQEHCVIEKRVTRSSAQKSKYVNDEVNESDSGVRVRILSNEKKYKVSKNAETLVSRKQNVGEKRVTRSSVRRNKILCSEVSDSSDRIRVSSKEGNIEKRVTRSPSEGTMTSKPSMCKREVKESGDENCKRKMKIGEKRKRNQVEVELGIVQGWSKEQELALQRAYFTAKPTPQFWKKVARMVPGKSAVECFDRIQSDHLTPSQRPTRSRPNKKITSPLSFSASKLLTPAELKTKRLRPSRRNTLAAQKTVRQLLQKQQKEDEDYEADFFAVFEPTANPCPLNFQEGTPFSSPASNQGSCILKRFRETSSSAKKKHFSRLHSLNKAGFVSPPVLKQVKNKALHEKYIDQLHCRDAKRKAQSLRNEKYMQEENDAKRSHLKVNSVKFAKDALVFAAQDAINQFRVLQSSTNDNIDDDDDDDISHGDEDEI